MNTPQVVGTLISAATDEGHSCIRLQRYLSDIYHTHPLKHISQIQSNETSRSENVRSNGSSSSCWSIQYAKETDKRWSATQLQCYPPQRATCRGVSSTATNSTQSLVTRHCCTVVPDLSPCTAKEEDVQRLFFLCNFQHPHHRSRNAKSSLGTGFLWSWKSESKRADVARKQETGRRDS